jgi:hypothetical protein
MIRPLTLVCALLAAGSGLYLYQTKHQAQLLDRQIQRVREATEATLARAGVMRAEYALLKDPDRLEEFAAQYLPDLRPTQPAQWTSMSELDKRLPPVGAPADQPSPLEAEPPPVARTEPPVHPAPIIAAAAVAARPVAVAAARVAPHPMVAARPAALVAPAPAQVAVAARPVPLATAAQVPHGQAAPTLVATQVPAPRAAPPPGVFARQTAPIYAAAAARADPYAAAPSTAGVAISRIARGGTVDPSLPVVASALGMARTMMTVSPVGQANAPSLYPASAAR